MQYIVYPHVVDNPGDVVPVRIYMHDTDSIFTATTFKKIDYEVPRDNQTAFIDGVIASLWDHPRAIESNADEYIAYSNGLLRPQYNAGVSTWYGTYFSGGTLQQANQSTLAYIQANMPDWKAAELQAMLDDAESNPDDWLEYTVYATFLLFGLMVGR